MKPLLPVCTNHRLSESVRSDRLHHRLWDGIQFMDEMIACFVRDVNGRIGKNSKKTERLTGGNRSLIVYPMYDMVLKGQLLKEGEF